MKSNIFKALIAGSALAVSAGAFAQSVSLDVNGTLTNSCEVDKTTASITIADNGLPIPKKNSSSFVFNNSNELLNAISQGSVDIYLNCSRFVNVSFNIPQPTQAITVNGVSATVQYSIKAGNVYSIFTTPTLTGFGGFDGTPKKFTLYATVRSAVNGKAIPPGSFTISTPVNITVN